LIALAIFALIVWAFVALAGEVVEGDTRAFDRAILLAFRNPADISQPLGSPAVQEMARDVTALGGVTLLSLITLSVAGYLLLTRNDRIMLFLLLAIGGGALLSTLLKMAFDRPRPDLVPHAVYVDSASFPSGHSMLSAITYLTLGALLARVQTSLRVKVYLVGLAVLLTVIVGLSRIYLAVHWPTDVLAGWTAGAAWALLCWFVAYALQRRGKLERSVKPPDEPAGRPPEDESLSS
jgi:undecaprenyl-diphosphatase